MSRPLPTIDSGLGRRPPWAPLGLAKPLGRQFHRQLPSLWGMDGEHTQGAPRRVPGGEGQGEAGRPGRLIEASQRPTPTTQTRYFQSFGTSNFYSIGLSLASACAHRKADVQRFKSDSSSSRSSRARRPRFYRVAVAAMHTVLMSAGEIQIASTVQSEDRWASLR